MIDEAIKAALIAEYNAIPPREELEKMYTFSERHERQMAEIFANLDKFDEKCRRRYLVRKVAIILIVVLALAAVSVKFVPEVYAFVKEWLMEIKEDRIRFEGKSADKDARAVEELRFELGYVPDGYELVSEVELNTGVRSLLYKNLENDVLRLEYNHAVAMDLFAINTENALVEEVNYKDIVYRVFECKGRKLMIVWEYQGYVLKVEGMFDKKQLLGIAESIKITSKK